MKVVTDLVGEANKYMAATSALASVKEVARWITRVVNIFGLDTASTPGGEDRIGWSDNAAGTAAGAGAETPLMPYLRALSTFRDSVRQLAITNPRDSASADLLLLSDRLRDYDLAALGVALDDRDSGVGKPALVKFVPAAELIAAREEKERRVAEKEKKKEEARAKKEEEDRKKAELGKLSQVDIYRTEEWSEWDEEGMPTKDREGKELTKSRGKALRKGWEKQKKVHEAYLASQGAIAN